MNVVFRNGDLDARSRLGSLALPVEGGSVTFLLTAIIRRASGIMQSTGAAKGYAPSAIPTLFFAHLLIAAAERLIGRHMTATERGEFLVTAWPLAASHAPQDKADMPVAAAKLVLGFININTSEALSR